MRLLNPDFNLDHFFDVLTRSNRSALMLDYDGTLAPFVPDRDRAVPYQGIRERLNRLQGVTATRLVIVSGRQAKDIIPLLALDGTPEIWGMHGAERRLPDGTIQVVQLPPEAAAGLDRIDSWAKEAGLTSLVERKATSRAFHWRGLPASEGREIHLRVTGAWSETSATFGLEVHEFDGGLELKVAGIDKARAVDQVIGELPADAPLAYAGDDRTDEDAFAALAGRGLRVLVRTQQRTTAADLWLTPPEELLAFLDRWLQSVE
ncbi:MAG TPA: trehalose-phosphatase [Acidobacteriota bacterium]|nr:trehalose-phosphatase [Acidobacteriota bacterium]